MRRLSRWVIIISGFSLVNLVLLAVIYHRTFNWNGSDDLKIAWLADNGVKIVSISPERKMVNQLIVGQEVKLWVPGGYSWYLSDRIKKLLETEKKMALSSDLFFYNFGFVPDKIIVTDQTSEVISDWELIKKIGFLNYIKYKKVEPGLMEKTEKVKEEVKDNEKLSESLVRDFADNKLVAEETRISVINSSGVNGLAGWITSRFEWEGMTVIGVETGEVIEGKCQIIMGKEAGKTKTIDTLRRFFKCAEKVDEGMGELEIELSLSKDFGEVIKY